MECKVKNLGMQQNSKDFQGNKLPGFVNIEFEAKLFQDVIGGGNDLCWRGFRGDHIPIERSRSYYDWI